MTGSERVRSAKVQTNIQLSTSVMSSIASSQLKTSDREMTFLKSMTHTSWLKSLICTLAFLSVGGPPNWGHASQPNLIWIMADDLGYGELGCYGQKVISTSQIDRMAAEGMKFTHFYSGATVCAPSRSVLITGLHHGHTRVRGNAA